MDDDEFDFSGHELDGLPADELDELETTAIQATQHRERPDTQAHDSDYGFDDGEEVINLDDAADATRFGQLQHSYDYNPVYGDGDPMEVDVGEAPRQSQADPSRLLKRIKELELEKRSLNLRLQTATDEASKKAGEADNLRRRADTERREAAQRLAHVERQHNEAREQLKAEKENAQRQLETTRTSEAFDQHDSRLAEQAEQTRQARRGFPTRSRSAASPARTPRKTQRTLQGDGFDDAEAVSPSKRKERVKIVTPRQAHKRKRLPPNDSPVPALQLSAPREHPKAPAPAPSAGKVDVALLRRLWKGDDRYALLQRLLAHRCSNGRDRVMEALTQHAFPSQPSKKLSSVVYDSLSGLRLSPNAHELALRLCRVFFHLWAQCLREKHYSPVCLILDALHFILACEPASTAVATTEQIIPLVVDSIDLVAYPVAEAASRSEGKVAALYSPQQRSVRADIDIEPCLELLYLVATSCVSSPSADALASFWRTMSYTHVLVLLHRNQPVPQMSLMLRVLATSALPTSLGPKGIHSRSDARDEASIETAIIMRLASMFSEIIEPIPDPDITSPEATPEAVPEARIWQLRLKVLDVLTQFSMTEHGCAKLASDHYCLGRLVKYLNHCVASLYTQPLSPTQSYKIASINATMKLIHHVVTQTGTPIKMKLKGAQHAYNVALMRIASSDRLVLEAGIDDWVMDMAHEILDQDMGLEEGEAFQEVFPNAIESSTGSV
ncbi:hypothetical protein P280DRAFT_428981 [Massarina eburnea CBS 473.64]|uniref:DNA repair protein Rad26 n=1 Tax=Massarina eburnea CBS 473.64 TaxID=1395130 RepID=A0A6A6RWF9_9PLEO|nr:hypothetical protein P280DRAFT_428981 [Massarina eburnea CBS 473.64]